MNGVSKTVGIISPEIPVARAKGAPAPWAEVLLTFAITSIAIGVIWDISWHMSIGRDTFWTPAHMAIYLGGTLAGCIGGWLAIKHTFLAGPEDRASSVKILGARAPLGAWVAIWGAIAMLTSGPFDDWWHNAYGLDVKIFSPPHMLLGLGMLAISVAAMLLALARQNREPGGAGGGIFIFAGGMFTVLGGVFVSEFAYPNLQHGAAFFSVAGAMFAFRLVTVGRAGRVAWPATSAALIYMAVECLMVWILPLFPAQPKLAPIFNPMTHMAPPTFPLLVVFPALAVDLFLRKFGERDQGGLRRIGYAIAIGVIFLAIFFPVQWFFSDFLLSPHAENWFFVGNRFWSYTTENGSWHTEFWRQEFQVSTLETIKAIARNLLWISLATWLALVWGGWMRKVKR